MSEVREANVRTSVFRSGNKIRIKTECLGENNADDPPFILEAFIAQESSELDGVEYKEGDLIIIMNNFPSKINVEIVNLVELSVIANDADLYFISQRIGDLIYDFL